MIAIAKTGSGKTLSFVWPLLMYIAQQTSWKKGDGPIGLILTPTRELCQQIYKEVKTYIKPYSFKATCIYGGVEKKDQFRELRRNSTSLSVIVATPGRLIDMVLMKATHLNSISYVIIDEVDRMLDMGFEPQVRSILDHIRPDRQLLLFTATFPKSLESISSQLLNDPIKLIIGPLYQVRTIEV
jgi:ATP-dependent RNA helicase DDX42